MDQKFLFLSLALFSVLLLAGCLDIFQGTNSTPSPSNDQNSLHLGTPFTLQIGKSTSIPSENLSILFYQVEQDSRCPKGVDCVWQGEVVLDVDILKDEENIGRVILSTLDSGKSTKTIGNYSVQLVSVFPYPSKDKSGVVVPIKPKDYVATFVVKKSS